MRFVMEEVNALKNQLSDKELKIKRDQKVADLTQQVGWFKREALDLKNSLDQK